MRRLVTLLAVCIAVVGFADAALGQVAACCYADGSCLMQDQATCEGAAGTFLGVGAACTGDVDQNGIDDICEITRPVPAFTGWGLAAMVLLLVVAGAIVLRRRTATA